MVTVSESRPEQTTYWGEWAQDFDPILRSDGMGWVHAGEVREACRGVGRGPAENVAQLRRVGVDGVPRHQKLLNKHSKQTLIPQQTSAPLSQTWNRESN